MDQLLDDIWEAILQQDMELAEKLLEQFHHTIDYTWLVAEDSEG